MFLRSNPVSNVNYFCTVMTFFRDYCSFSYIKNVWKYQNILSKNESTTLNGYNFWCTGPIPRKSSFADSTDIEYYCLSTHTIWAILRFDWFPRPILLANITFPQCHGTLSRQVAVKVRSNLQSWFHNFLLTMFACFQAIFCTVQTLMY